MLAFFLDILKMPYKTGGYQDSKHENRVKQLFLKHKFVERPKGSDLKDGEFISQPRGKNNNPDFYVKHNGKLYSVECKSSAGISPTYNGALPKQNYIYIFSSGKYNATTIYYGRDVVSLEQEKVYAEMKDELAKVQAKYNSLLRKADSFKRGFGYYRRDMYIQEGGQKLTDYFKHPDREKCERNVLNTFR